MTREPGGNQWGQAGAPGQAATVWADAKARFDSAVLGPHFEQLCREWAGRFADDVTIGGDGAGSARLLCFSATGFTTELRAAERDGQVSCIGLDDLYPADEPR